MTKLKNLHTKWMKDPAYRKAYDGLEAEFALASAIAEARGRAGLTQEQVAQLMHTTQSLRFPLIFSFVGALDHPTAAAILTACAMLR